MVGDTIKVALKLESRSDLRDAIRGVDGTETGQVVKWKKEPKTVPGVSQVSSHNDS